MLQIVVTEKELDLILHALAVSAASSTGTELISLGNELENRARRCRELSDAVEFLDRVRDASEAEKLAVGTDHWVRLEAAARAVASHTERQAPGAL